jgi:hypothetical protein
VKAIFSIFISMLKDKTSSSPRSEKDKEIFKDATFESIIKFAVSPEVIAQNMAKKKAKQEAKKQSK